jgi:hypothetical protein
MPENIKERIRESFNENDKEQVVKYMDLINSSISNYTQTVRRSAAILLLLVAAFELVIGSQKTTLSIGSFSLSKGSIALSFLPAVVSFLFMQIIFDTRKVNRLDRAFSETFKIWSPKASENELDHILGEPQPIYWNTRFPLYIKNVDSLDKIEENSVTIVMLIITFGFAVFEGQAYYALYPNHISAIPAWAASLLITLFCLVVSVCLMARA